MKTILRRHILTKLTDFAFFKIVNVGNTYASVFPEPVGACTITSLCFSNNVDDFSYNHIHKNFLNSFQKMISQKNSQLLFSIFIRQLMIMLSYTIIGLDKNIAFNKKNILQMHCQSVLHN